MRRTKPFNTDVDVGGGEVNLLFNFTINDISVIYVTAHRCAGGKNKINVQTIGAQ